jgi:cobalt-zinc-cadmium efflux system outer membrane protein
LGVSVPLPIRNRNQGNIRAARAEVDSAAAAIDQTRLDLESRLAGAVGRYQMAKERFERLRDLVLPSADETFQLSISAVEAGESSYLQLLTAQRTLFTTQLSALDALSQALQANAEIEGMLVTLK